MTVDRLKELIAMVPTGYERFLLEKNGAAQKAWWEYLPEAEQKELADYIPLIFRKSVNEPANSAA